MKAQYDKDGKIILMGDNTGGRGSNAAANQFL
jgi:hypothetical protein